jgi:D-amino-acid dehydrogenase
MASPKTAQVIGGGIIGLNVALALQERGLAVVIVDPALETPSASWGNAGHIATEQVAPLASWASVRSLPSRIFALGGVASFPMRAVAAWLPFGLRLMAAARPARFASGKAAMTALLAEALPAWRRRVANLGKADLLKEDGHIVLWESDASAKAGRAAWQRTDTGTTTWQDLSATEGAELQRRFSTPIAGGIRFQGSASIADPTDLLSAMRAKFEANGGAFERKAASAALAAHADIRIICAGVASGKMMQSLGHSAPMIAERGYHIQTTEQAWDKGLPPLVFEDRAVVVTQFRSALRATSFVEFARAGDPPDPGKWRRLIDHAKAIGLHFDEGSDKWMGARPTLPDYLPAIGRSDRVPGLFYAFGHNHLGLTTGPITGELVAALVTGEVPSVDLSPFSLARFER